jgi:succinate dehydrogenase / fumarate reductase flavoprotein subunit
MMQDLVGIVRREEEMARAVDGLETLRQRANRAGVTGNREYNPGWHTALDLPNLLTVSEAVARSAIERKESRGGHFRDDYPEKDAAWGSFNLVVERRPDGEMAVRREPVVGVTDELTRLVEKFR